jgi:hypothetical protein
MFGQELVKFFHAQTAPYWHLMTPARGFLGKSEKGRKNVYGGGARSVDLAD